MNPLIDVPEFDQLNMLPFGGIRENGGHKGVVEWFNSMSGELDLGISMPWPL